MDAMYATHGFGPEVEPDSEILILGSFPSVKSREHGFFYMYPQNRFWTVLSILFEDDFINTDIAKKRHLLKKYHIALYDVIESCTIKGSSDASITGVMPADIAKIISNTQIRRIYLNGRKAYDLFNRYDRQFLKMATLLPSTSPANAAMRLEGLVDAWQIIKQKAP
ncbi:MAG TPA: DNA-deoxyinosine glycosylase [Bacillota bacterium]|nr:DNA-deoxyinosine glycosylase [Bacillota bacterium]HPF42628.1 DNA-deoxyinosine glycosylase [Bacillota bacterium]HPJ86208.1 DNA-deoxyinosine glycosylase [Bacillota bacterium]HPQ62259.1 DNA-deoxyinosine glycosylase [Bacillota bacterium]